MDRFKRITHRGWLRRFLTVATFGYFPLAERGAVVYVVEADAECRFAVMAVSAVRLVTIAGAELRSLASADGALRSVATGNSAIRVATGAVDVEL